MKILAFIYGVIIYLRNRLYDLKILKTRKVENVEIICIGNIVAGGTGKTPAVQYFAKKYMDMGRKVGILSRGYKGKRKKEPLLVRNEHEIVVTQKESGDEAYLHALNLKIPIAVSKDRYSGAVYLRDVCKVDTIIMDDGFQHRKLEKDKNIVLIDCTDPFGGNNYLPKGRLRESLKALYRADEIILTKSNYVTREAVNTLKKILEKYGKPITTSIFTKKYFYNFEGEKIQTEKIRNKKVMIFSSIAKPKVFYNTIKKLNPSEIMEIKFADHHKYESHEIAQIYSDGKNCDYIITTEKDIVKINKKNEKLLILKMEFEIVG